MAKVFTVLGLDPTLPDVTLEIGGRVRHLAFDFTAIRIAEKEAGASILKILDDVSVSNIATLLYAALLKDDPKLTYDEVGSWITLKNWPICYQAVVAAWLESAEEKKEDEPAADNAEGEEKAVPAKRKRTA